MKKIVSSLILIGCVSTNILADEEEPPTAVKLRESDTVQFWQPEYLQQPKELPTNALRLYILPQILGAQFTHPSSSFASVDPTLVNKFSGPSTRGFLFYGGEIGLYLSDQLSINASMYMGSGSGGNSLENSALGGFIDRVYSVKMYQGGLTYYFAKILYASTFVGYRSTDLHSNLGFLVGTQFKRADVNHVNYNKVVYGFGLGFNFEIADHFLLRIGANVMPQFIVDYGFSGKAEEYPVSLQMGLGVIF